MENQMADYLETEKSSRKKQAELTRNKLLSVSLKLMKEHGFDKVKISDICEEANVSTGAFYHHIKNKAGIVIEGYAQCDQYFAETVYPLLKDRYDVDAILEYVEYQMKYGEDFGVDLCIQMYKAQLTEGTEFFLSQERALPKGLISIVNSLQVKGVIQNQKDAKIIANEILVISRGILYNWCQCNGQYDVKRFAREIISNYLKSYAV